MNKIIPNWIKLGLAALICCSLIGCEYINSKVQKNPASQKQQKCWNLKNQIAFDQTSTNGGASDLGKDKVTQVAKAMSEYKDNNCDEFDTSGN